MANGECGMAKGEGIEANGQQASYSQFAIRNSSFILVVTLNEGVK